MHVVLELTLCLDDNERKPQSSGY